MGSNPIGVTILVNNSLKIGSLYIGRLAQLGERLPYKQDVSSSILLSPTILQVFSLIFKEFFILMAMEFADKSVNSVMTPVMYLGQILTFT